jgi:hypothetical protein
MKIKLEAQNAALYSRLYVSSLDLDFAGYCLGVLLTKGWHYQAWERPGRIYKQQSAFTSAFVIAYGRPFTKSKGWPQFPSELMDFDSEESALHEHMMELRHTIYAHSDSKHYEVTPWRTTNFSTDILSALRPRITAKEAALLKRMISKLQVAIRHRMRKILP